MHGLQVAAPLAAVEFPAFDHGRFLARPAPRHDLGGSGFVPDNLDLPAVRPGDVTGLDVAGFAEAVAAHLDLEHDQVCPTVGTSGANLAAIASHVEPGCSVVCERPYYAPMPHAAQGLGARLRFVDRDATGALDPEAVADAIDATTRLVLLTSPNNPTGHASTRQELHRIADAAHDHGALVLVDQVFRELTDHALAADHPALVSTGGLNKCWGAAGLRAGWAAGHPDVVRRLAEVHQLLLLSPGPIGARLGTALLAQGAERRQALLDRIQENHEIFGAWCRRHGVAASHGELTAFVQAPHADTHALAEDLLVAGVRAVPGEFFGRGGHLRVGLGGPSGQLESGLEALAAAW